MLRKPRWIAKDDASANGEKPGLPDERKALVERYMIDAEEAERRASHAAEQQARHEAAAEVEARQAAEEQARREAAEAEAQRQAAEEQARRGAAEAEARRRAAEEQAQREAAEEQARREAAEEQARRQAAEAEAQRQAAEEQTQREAAEEQARREAAEEQARRDAAEAELVAHRDVATADEASTEQPEPTTDEFPIYGWLQRSGPAPTTDWPRSLVEAKESRRDERETR